MYSRYEQPHPLRFGQLKTSEIDLCGSSLWFVLSAQFPCCISQARVVVVTLLVPIVVRLYARVGNAANLFELFDPVFKRGY
jgi:hypothetical protein